MKTMAEIAFNSGKEFNFNVTCEVFMVHVVSVMTQPNSIS